MTWCCRLRRKMRAATSATETSCSSSRELSGRFSFTPCFRAFLGKNQVQMLDGVEGANPSDSKDQGSAKRSKKRATPDVPREARGEQPSSDGDEVTYEVTRART